MASSLPPTFQKPKSQRELLRYLASEPTRARIRADRDLAPERLRPIFSYLEEAIFEPGLNVKKLKEALSIRDNSLVIYFHAQIGVTPKSYITDRRMETAARLLEDTDLLVWEIGELLGYSSLAVFGRAFARWSGERPLQYRRLRKSAPASSAATAPEPGVNDHALALCLAGLLPTDRAVAIMAHLAALYPEAATVLRARRA